MAQKSRFKGRPNFGEKSPLDSVLVEKLNEVIGEGILDSILPFICAAILPVQSDKSNLNHTCGLKTKTNGGNKLLSPRIAGNNSEAPSTSRTSNENSLAPSSKERQRRKSNNQPIGLLSE